MSIKFSGIELYSEEVKGSLDSPAYPLSLSESLCILLPHHTGLDASGHFLLLKV